MYCLVVSLYAVVPVVYPRDDIDSCLHVLLRWQDQFKYSAAHRAGHGLSACGHSVLQ